MTRAELAFSALDRSKTGFITQKELKKLSKKLSNQKLMALMKQVIVGVLINTKQVITRSLTVKMNVIMLK